MTGGAGRAAIAILTLACAPAISVRPGSRSAPTVFRVEVSAREVVLSGTMTGWQGRPLEQRGRAFELSLELPPGRYEYRLEVHDTKGARLVHPRDAERVDDGFGGENTVLRVP